MGFWKKLKDAGSRLVDKVEDVTNSVINTVESAAEYVAEKVVTAGEYVATKYQEAKSYVDDKINELASLAFSAFIDTSGISELLNHVQSESEKLASASQRMNIISNYQIEVEKDATYRESILKETYVNMYKLGILDSFDTIFDTTKIRQYIEKQSKRFDHVMRDEVNHKVSPKELEEMANSFHGTAKAFDEKVNKFAHSVYKEAKCNLEDLFVEIVNETNNTIKEEAEKYLRDENESLNEFKQTLINLSAEGHEKEEQLKAIAFELTTMEFIKHEVKKYEYNRNC